MSIQVKRTTGTACWRTVWSCAALLCIMLVPSQTRGEGDTEAMLSLAIEGYSSALEETSRDRRLASFARAEQLFRQVTEAIEAGNKQPSAELLLNLGNAALQAEHLGTAVLNYRRALILSPNDAKARQNLAFAREQVDEWARYEVSDPLIDTLFFWRRSFSSDTILGIAALCFIAAALLVAVSIFSRISLLRNLAIFPLVLWCVLLISVAGGQGAENMGVIVTEEAILRSANSGNAQAVLSQPLPDGAEVKVLQQRGDWVEIKMTGRSGWVSAQELALIES